MASEFPNDIIVVSTIPPIYERSTASNISFEEGGEFNLLLNPADDLFQVPEKCSPLSKESSASHGVRSRPVDAVFGTTSLLSPKTEKEFLKKAWPTVLFTNPKTQTATTVEEDNSVFSTWEENYQDLSGWCMDPFQGRCAFPIGEFIENRHSGTKNEDYGVSIKKEAMITKNRRDFLEKKGSLERSDFKDTELPFDVLPEININCQEDSLPGIKAEIAETKEIDLDDVLLNPTESSISPRTEDWVQLTNTKETNNSKISTQESVDSKNCKMMSGVYPNTIPFELTKNEKNNWDDIDTFDNSRSDSFDLLSYLCDDNIQSPESSVSLDSNPTLKSNSSITSSADVSSTTRELRNTRRAKDVGRNYAEASTSSASSIAAISAALDSVKKMSRKTSRAQKHSSSGMRKDSESSKQRRGKKRCIESDSEDRMSDCSYRESREKNNEASRKSRMNKKAKEKEMIARAGELERDNRILKMKVEELEKLVTSMRSAILRSALKKSST